MSAYWIFIFHSFLVLSMSYAAPSFQECMSIKNLNHILRQSMKDKQQGIKNYYLSIITTAQGPDFIEYQKLAETITKTVYKPIIINYYCNQSDNFNQKTKFVMAVDGKIILFRYIHNDTTYLPQIKYIIAQIVFSQIYYDKAGIIDQSLVEEQVKLTPEVIHHSEIKSLKLIETRTKIFNQGPENNIHVPISSGFNSKPIDTNHIDSIKSTSQQFSSFILMTQTQSSLSIGMRFFLMALLTIVSTAVVGGILLLSITYGPKYKVDYDKSVNRYHDSIIGKMAENSYSISMLLKKTT